MAFYNKNINALYIHIPKCYGTFTTEEIYKFGFKRCCSIDIMKKKLSLMMTR